MSQSRIHLISIMPETSCKDKQLISKGKTARKKTRKILTIIMCNSYPDDISVLDKWNKILSIINSIVNVFKVLKLNL